MSVQTRVSQASVLPVSPTSFVDRREETSQAKRLLGTERVVTLMGPGGVGKTRLALHVAAELRRAYADGVWLVELADVRDGALLAQSVAERLGLQDRSHDPVHAVTSYLAERQLLLVLDNCEHLIDECAPFVALLVKSCPGLRLLATSRQSLGITGEVTLLLPPLSAPDAAGAPDGPSFEDALNYDSVRLFAERARAILPSFELHQGNAAEVARLCRRLDGLPLAIELAAVRIRALTPAQIEERLASRYRLLTSRDRTAPERQQTLQALVDWSHQLCTDQERLMWARMSVFSGGFTLDAAERVCSGDELDAEDVLDVIDSLVDKSLLVAEETDGMRRFRVLETIREYGAERLAESAELDLVRQRHRDWCADLARDFMDSWLGPDEVRWVSRMAREHPNLRVALDYCLSESRDPLTALGIVTKLEDYWGIRGLNIEFRYWLDRALPLAGDPSPQRLAGLRAAGWSALLQEEIDVDLPMLEEASRLVDEVGGGTDNAYLRHIWGLAAFFAGDLEQAAALAESALADFRQAGDLRGELFSLFLVGLTRGLSGDREHGLALLEEAIATSTQIEDVYWRGWAWWAVCVIEIGSGNLPRAGTAGKQALTLQRKLNNRLAIAVTVDALACVAARTNRHNHAATLFGIGDRLASEVGTDPSKNATLGAIHDEHTRISGAELGEEAYEADFSKGRSMPDGAALDLALEIVPDRVRVKKPSRAGSSGPLTRREREIAELVGRGMSNKDIAERLVVSTRTTEGHVENILRKLGFRSRTQVAAWVASQQDRG